MSDKYRNYDVVLKAEVTVDGVWARSSDEAVDMVVTAMSNGGQFDVEILDEEIHCFEEDND